MKKSKVFSELDRLCRDEIMLMDGPLGTMVQKHKLQEEDYRGDLLKNHSLDLKGNNEILNITRPNIIKEIHKSYINSGSKIIETNTFGATSIAQSDYKLEHLVEKMNIESVKVAKDIEDTVWPSNVQMPDYEVVDVSFTYDMNDKSSVYFKVQNLADEKYETIKGYNTGGRQFFAGIRASF